ncbi:N-acetylmuramoyl-L-alanine amidase [Phenylobacterium sp.]|jgi:N-acetylmuramoyl-L-alanine amidase|uniref:N-acetylmuramoyl-L-alanine amidase n=1 Tax=Phenylobacterium sp. TaxID=1871053 RepID=UPI0037C67D59
MKEKVFVVWMSHWRWRKVWLFLALAGWGLLFVASPAVSQAADLRSVRLGGDSVSTRLVLDLSGEAAGRLLSDAGGKIVVSLADAEVEAPMRGPGRGLVRAWSVTPQAGGGARLSVETAVGVTVRRRFLLPPSEGSPGYRYVIDFEMASPLKVPGETVRLTSLKETSGSAAAAPRKSAKSRVDSRKIVVIDAGHGGTDPGALGDEHREKDLTLAAALALRDRLQRTGRYRVVMTRDRDVYVPLDTRVQIARKANANLFISLHADSGPDESVRGASVYTLADKAVGRSARLVTRDDWFMKAGYHSDQSVSGILFDLTQRATKNRSATFAQLLLDEIGDNQALLRRSHREAGLAVLLAPDVPAVLLEMGFMTNPTDEALLANPASRGRLVGAVASAIDAYFRNDVQVASR